jgi:hypothetical protein
MKIGEYEFSYVGDIEPVREAGGTVEPSKCSCPRTDM